ncbi:hypothetical protein EPYR_00514 [Erwinia pyrifoliae DSM 12163]|nr:hypothetical protein EPYR_00514 [Erwinia pyrifoliae DSM 12163]
MLQRLKFKLTGNFLFAKRRFVNGFFCGRVLYR